MADEQGSTSASAAATKPSVTMARERGNPKIEPKLAGQHNFAQWILSIEQTLEQYDHEDGSTWDIVTGVLKPSHRINCCRNGKEYGHRKKRDNMEAG